MSHGFVTGATVKNRKITFSVMSEDFETDEWLEISGNATQAGGAFADIHAIVQVSAPASGAKPSVDVTVDVPHGQDFDNGKDVTVFIQVAYVWVTVLGPGPAKVGDTVVPGTWANIKLVSEIGSKPYIPPGSN
jgi:hypothetical protein